MPVVKCEYCETVEHDGLQPFGKNNEMICFDCGMDSRNFDNTYDKMWEMKNPTHPKSGLIYETHKNKLRKKYGVS